jgi:uncharacterized delta-60 repeat protein
MQFKITKNNLLVACLTLTFFGFVPPAFALAEAIINAGAGSALENAGVVIFTVSRSENASTVVSVDYATREGTAKAGIDYRPISGTLTFAAGETEKTISIRLADDDGLVDGDKSFQVSLSNATGGAVIGTSEGIVTIQDNEVPANLDYSFNPVISSLNGGAGVLSLATLPDGKLVIGGWFTRVNGVERSGLACLNPDGSLAPLFQVRLLSAGNSSGASQIKRLPDGRVYIAGGFDSVDGVDRPGLARLLQDGSLDLSFTPTNSSYWVAVQSDGKILSVRDSLVRLNLDGRRDNSFVAPAHLTNIQALAELTDGKLLVSVWGVANPVLRLNRDGSFDDSFKSGSALGFGDEVQQFFVQSDQKILVTGTFYSTNGDPVSNLKRLNADGSLDTGFQATTGPESHFYSATLAENGKIIGLSGYPPYPPTAWRLNADGTFDSTFPGFHILYHSGLAGYRSEIRSFGAVAYVYGNFFTVNGAVVYPLGRILLDRPRTGFDIQSVETGVCACSYYLRTVRENDSVLMVKVRRLGETIGPATVSYSTRDGTAIAGQDYLLTSGVLSFAPLEVEKIVSVPILNNSALDGRRTLQLYLTNAVGADFIAPPLTVTILDDENGFRLGALTRLSDGGVRVIVENSDFRSILLETSSDLKTWTLSTSFFQNDISPFEIEFLDPDAENFSARFYRVRTE